MNLGGTVHLNRGATIAIICGVIFLYVLYHNGPSNATLKDADEEKSINLREVLSAAIDAAQRGGVKVYNVRKSADIHEKLKGKTLEGAKDPITDGDLLSHFEMTGSLKLSFPNINIISEEKPEDKQKSLQVTAADINMPLGASVASQNEFVNPDDLQIWVDPLDATHEYTENLLEYVTTMVCVAYKGEPIIGVIHKPFSNSTSWAWVKKGSSEGLEVGKTKKEPTVNDIARIIISRSHKGEVEVVAKEAFDDKAVITEGAGAGFKCLEVISGRQDVYVHTSKIKLWDICAGDAILRHFGGYMTTLSGNQFTYGAGVSPENYDGIVAALYNHKYYVEKFRKLKKIPQDLAHLVKHK